MEQKVQLKHPQGKKAISIDKDKYELLKKQLTKFLTDHSGATFAAISKAISKELTVKKIKFEGSLDWYLEWVKLDLEARQIISRVPKTTPQKYLLTAG